MVYILCCCIMIGWGEGLGQVHHVTIIAGSYRARKALPRGPHPVTAVASVGGYSISGQIGDFRFRVDPRRQRDMPRNKNEPWVCRLLCQVPMVFLGRSPGALVRAVATVLSGPSGKQRPDSEPFHMKIVELVGRLDPMILQAIYVLTQQVRPVSSCVSPRSSWAHLGCVVRLAPPHPLPTNAAHLQKIRGGVPVLAGPGHTLPILLQFLVFCWMCPPFGAVSSFAWGLLQDHGGPLGHIFLLFFLFFVGPTEFAAQNGHCPTQWVPHQ